MVSLSTRQQFALPVQRDAARLTDTRRSTLGQSIEIKRDARGQPTLFALGRLGRHDDAGTFLFGFEAHTQIYHGGEVAIRFRTPAALDDKAQRFHTQHGWTRLVDFLNQRLDGFIFVIMLCKSAQALNLEDQTLDDTLAATATPQLSELVDRCRLALGKAAHVQGRPKTCINIQCRHLPESSRGDACPGPASIREAIAIGRP